MFGIIWIVPSRFQVRSSGMFWIIQDILGGRLVDFIYPFETHPKVGPAQKWNTFYVVSSQSGI